MSHQLLKVMHQSAINTAIDLVAAPRSNGGTILIPERRTFERIVIHCPVIVTGTRDVTPAFLVNVSESGALLTLYCSVNIQIGQEVTVFPADQTPIIGYVRWRDPMQIGVHFAERHRTLIDRLDTDYLGTNQLLHRLNWQSVLRHASTPTLILNTEPRSVPTNAPPPDGALNDR